MSVDIRYPNISGLSEKEQISQIKSYLHQLVDQLNYAFPTLGNGGSTYEVQGEQVSYYELRSLIMQEIQEVETLFNQLSQKMQTGYVAKSGWATDKYLATDSSGVVVAVDPPEIPEVPEVTNTGVIKELLWENDNSQYGFEASDVLLDLSAYDGIEIVGREYFDDTEFVPVTTGYVPLHPAGPWEWDAIRADLNFFTSGCHYQRVVWLHADRVSFDTCYYYWYTTDTPDDPPTEHRADDNESGIPMQIYGYKLGTSTQNTDDNPDIIGG